MTGRGPPQAGSGGGERETGRTRSERGKPWYDAILINQGWRRVGVDLLTVVKWYRLSSTSQISSAVPSSAHQGDYCTIVDAGGDDVMIVKENQLRLHSDLVLVFTEPPIGDHQGTANTVDRGIGVSSSSG